MSLMQNLQSFTFLKDSHGLIFQALGAESQPPGNFLWVTLSYYRAGAETGMRRQVATNESFVKFVCHGYDSEIQRMCEELPDWVLSRLRRMMRVRPDTGEEIFGLHVSEIAEVYNPVGSLQKLINGQVRGFPEASIRKLHEGIAALKEGGIDTTDLGLYGGLQCFLTHNDGTIKDLDFVVGGLDHYPNIIKLSQGNVVRPETFPYYVAVHPMRRAAAIRRGQISQFRLASDPRVTVDMRLARRPEDKTSFPSFTPEMLKGGRELYLENALVIEAAGSLSLPASYTVKSDGRCFTVWTRYYRNMGVATTGDEVHVRGLLVAGRQLLLLHPDRHYIYPVL